MKILLIHHFNKLGGGTLSALDLAKMLKDLGHDVILAVPNPSREIIIACDNLKIDLQDVKKPPLFTYHNASSNALRCFAKYVIYSRNRVFWKKIFLEQRPDVVFFNSSPISVLSGMLKKMNIPSVCCVRETYRYRGSKIANAFLKRMIGGSTVALYLTEYDRKTWATSNRYQFVLPDVVNEARYNRHTSSEIAQFKITQKLREGIKYILFLGGVSRAKGTLDLLKAFNIISKERLDVGLLLLGNNHRAEKMSLGFEIQKRSEAQYRKECWRLLDSMKSEGLKINEVGLVEDTSFWYESSVVVVFPVNLVHQPRPAYEAGYFEKPIIVPDYDNFSDYVIDGSNGLYYKKNNPEDLAAKLNRFFESPSEIMEMGQRNHEACLSCHSFEYGRNVMERVLDLFDKQ